VKAREIITGGPARILIVDDERTNRQLLEVMLSPEKFIIECASNGEESLAMVAHSPPDLVLLDIMMPGMSGYNVAMALKGNPATKSIPIIMITALDDRDARMLGLSAGAEDFLSKPVDRAELCMRVRNLLRLKAYGDYHDKYSQLLEREVTERTADLVESERLYRSTFDAAPVGIVHVGVDGQWLRINQRLCDLLGYSRDDLRGVAVRDLMDLADVTAEIASFDEMAKGLKDREVVGERRYRRYDGTFLWARVNTSVHRDAEGRPQHFISVVEDITEWRALETQFRQTNKMDAIGQLAAGVAHDFNNLLSVVVSYSELLADDLKTGDPMQDDLKEIKGAGLRGVELTRQLLAFSRKQVLLPQHVDLADIVTGMEKMVGRLIGEDIELSTTRTPSRGRILVDPGQMEQVIMNLAVNARDAMPNGGQIRVDTSELFLDEAYAAEHIGVKPGPHIVLNVTDNGTGMDRATLTHIFEPFFTTKDPGKGTGLGLATVFGIVRQSGGTIWVESELGVGTTFKVCFPIAEATGIPVGSLSPPEIRTLRGSETILLVEDEEPVRTLAAAILRRYGYNVLDAQSGGDAFLMCEQHTATIDLLLTDIVMPRMSGRQLAERLLPLRPGMKVLYMSGYTDDAVVRRGHLDAMSSFMHKPIRPEALARKVRETLGTARSA
jgi:two-component system, cell cycle sensor histidine kinase and response regulator CckA